VVQHLVDRELDSAAALYGFGVACKRGMIHCPRPRRLDYDWDILTHIITCGPCQLSHGGAGFVARWGSRPFVLASCRPLPPHSPSRPPFTRLSCLNPPRFGYNDPLMVRYAKGEPRARAAQS
jgi:hypothetical protein